MATDNLHKMGFRWVRDLRTGATDPPLIRCRVASAYAFSINGGSAIDVRRGDPVRFVAGGTVAVAQGSEIAGGNAETVFGIVAGFSPYWDGTFMFQNDHLPNAQGAYGTVLDRQHFLYVIPALGQLFEIDCDDAVTLTTEAAYKAAISHNCDHVLTTGSEPKSNCMLDISGHGTGAAQWQIKDISPTAENRDFAGNYVKLYVTINEGQLEPYSTTGV